MTVLLAGCGPVTGDAATPTTGTVEEQTLTVLAAASLTDVLGRIATDVETDHPGARVELSFAASSTIVQQVNEGAPADVIALAGEEPLASLEPSGHEPVVFTTNTLQIAVPGADPARINGVEDLAADGIRLVVCAEAVPCGAAAATLLDRAGIDPAIASYEHDARATLTKVALGEADAGIVYRTDVQAAGEAVRGVEISPALNVVSRYPVLALSDSDLAQAFVAEVLSARGQRHLAEAGFVAP